MIFADIKKSQCKHLNICILMDGSGKPSKKVCLDCKTRWRKEPIMKGVEELTHV